MLFFLKTPLPTRVLILAKELLPQSSWIMWAVLGMRADWLTAIPLLLLPVLFRTLLALVATGYVSNTEMIAMLVYETVL